MKRQCGSTWLLVFTAAIICELRGERANNITCKKSGESDSATLTQKNCGLRRFRRTEPPQTNVKLICTLGSHSQPVVQAGLKGLNHPENM